MWKITKRILDAIDLFFNNIEWIFHHVVNQWVFPSIIWDNKMARALQRKIGCLLDARNIHPPCMIAIITMVVYLVHASLYQDFTFILLSHLYVVIVVIYLARNIHHLCRIAIIITIIYLVHGSLYLAFTSILLSHLSIGISITRHSPLFYYHI